jgi:C-terminal processing protease CtpA/Prc
MEKPKMWPLKWLVIVFGVLLEVTLPYCAMAAEAAVQPSPDPEQIRIERLTGLGRLWGAVKFFHPALAYRDIDWDAALIAAIPKVQAAKTAEDYRVAIEDLLAVLKDTSTFAVLEGQGGELPTSGSVHPAQSEAPAAPYRVIGSAVIVNGMAMAEFAARNNAAETERVRQALQDELAKAKGAVFDLRFLRSSPASKKAWLSYLLDYGLRSQLSAVITAPVALGTYRFRQHYGYAAQGAGRTSANYHSSLVTIAPEMVHGRRSVSAPPMPFAFVIDAGTPDVSNILRGVQDAGLATIVEETDGKPRARPIKWSVPLKLPGGVTAYVRVGELVASDAKPGFEPDLQIPIASGDADPALEAALKSLSGREPRPRTEERAYAVALIPAYDQAYADMAFPNSEYRLLALFRFWAVVNYFFPYKYLMDRPWDPVLAEFIPKFEANKTAADYQLTVMLLAARMQDSHVGVRNAEAAREQLGGYLPPLVVGAVEGKSVIQALPEPADAAAAGIGIGDEVLAVDGETAEQRRSRFQPFIAASTAQALRRDLEPQLLRGSRDSVAKLRIKDASGTDREAEIKRTYDFARQSAKIRWLPTYRTKPETYGLLPSGIAYIDLERLTQGEVEAAMAAAEKAPAIIFDLRGYPQGTGFTIAPRLVKRPSNKPVIGALFLPPFLRGDYLAYEDASLIPKLSFVQPLMATDRPAYQGRVVVLINEWTQSQAEHSCLAFAAATDVTFIGSATAGANGDVTNLVLPGGLSVSFTGQEVRFAGNRQLQRLGVQPDIRVEPTIAGIRKGQDEVLEAAIDFLQRQSKL